MFQHFNKIVLEILLNFIHFQHGVEQRSTHTYTILYTYSALLLLHSNYRGRFSCFSNSLKYLFPENNGCILKLDFYW